MTKEHDISAIRQYLNSLSTQQLNEMLSAEYISDSTNYELIEAILNALESKAGGLECNVDEAHDFFKSIYSQTDLLYDDIVEPDAGSVAPAPKNYHKKVFKVFAVAAIIASLLIGFGVASFAKGYNVWEAMTTWTDSVFGYGVQSGSKSYNERFDQISSDLVSSGINNTILPKYVHEEYYIDEYFHDSTYEGEVFALIFSSSAKHRIVMKYTIIAVLPGQFPKDDGEIGVYYCGGLDHYVFTNEGFWNVVWYNENVICSITGVENEKELLKMIDSIYNEKGSFL